MVSAIAIVLFVSVAAYFLFEQLRGRIALVADRTAEISSAGPDFGSPDTPGGLWAILRRTFRIGPGSPRRHPFLAGLVILALLAVVLLGVFDGLLGGMHFEGAPTVTATSLTGGPFGFNDGSEIAKSVRVWREWASGDGSAHASPKTIAGLYLLVDTAFALLYGVLVLALIVAVRHRLADARWRRALVVLVVGLGVAVSADLLENASLWLAVDREAILPTGVLVAAKLKWLVLLILLGLGYIGLVGHFDGFEQGETWAQRLPGFARGLLAMRVGMIAVLLTWFVLFGPLVGEQMLDVIRRWDPFQAAAVTMLSLVIAVLAGQSTRRVYLRVATATPRFVPAPGFMPLASFRHDWNRRAGTYRLGAGIVVIVLGLIGLGVAFSGGTLGRGLLIPGVMVVLLAVMGRPLRERDVLSMQGRPRRVGHLSARMVAAAVPLVVGLGVVRSVGPEYALVPDAGNAWLIPLAGGVGVLVLLLYLALEWVRRHASARDRGHLDEYEVDALLARRGRRVAGLLSVVVIVATGVGLVVADTRNPPGLEEGLDPRRLLAVGAGLLALAHFLFYFFADESAEVARVADERRRTRRTVVRSPASLLPGPGMNADGPRRGFLVVLLGAFVAVMVRVVWDPIQIPQSLGGTTVALLWVLLVVVALEVVTRFSEASVPPKVLQSLGVRRSPVILGVAMWLVFMALVWQSPGFHDEAIQPAAPGAVDEVSIQQVFDDWLARGGVPFDEANGSTETPAERTAVPMFFVSAWGGGIRAAVWTSYVIDCAFGPNGASPVCPESADGRAHIVTMSGISGGSLGFVEYLAVTSSGQVSGDWVRQRLGDDYLSPALSRLFFVDIPLAMIGGSSGVDDRADVLRRSWESSWPGGEMSAGMLDVWSEFDVPLVVANGASVNDGCAVNVSPLRTNPRGVGGDCTSLAPFVGKDPGDFVGSLAATHDIVAFLGPDEDISLASAALMSARFPAISPTGRVESERARGEGWTGAGLDAIYTTDGGQLELSGALMSAQLWQALRGFIDAYNATSSSHCIIPVAVHIENGFGENVSNVSDSPPNEWLDPLIWSGASAKGGLVANARQRLAIEFSQPLVVGADEITLWGVDEDGVEVPISPTRFIFIRTRAHPGASAPLGWTLSEVTFEDLKSQLDQNADEFGVISNWLGEMTCRVGSRSAGG